MHAVLDAHCERHEPLARLIWSLINLDSWWRRVRADTIGALPEDGAMPLRSPARVPTVDLVIPIYGGFNLVRDCVRSLQQWTRHSFRAVLVQDGPDDRCSSACGR